MIQLPGYRSEKRLYVSEKRQVYLGIRESDGLRTALKVFLDHATGAALQRARAEFEALRALEHSSVPRAVELVEYTNHPILIMEYIDGVALAVLGNSVELTPVTCLRVALGAARALEQIHAKSYLHLDLSPRNIVVNPRTLDVHIIDFGSTRRIGEKERDRLEGTLLYISPEQTGRMNRGVDQRSDIYSLGATLYRLVCGRPPFEGNDAIALIHAHMARRPSPVSSIRPELPSTVGRILEKLLEKEPVDRYQTCAALAADLETCIEQLEQRGEIAEDLRLGTSDVPLRVLFREHLFGREGEVERLAAAFERASRDGGTEVVLVSGPPGIGKSALLDTIRPAALLAGGPIGRGEFDQYRRDVPFSGILAALESLVDQMFASDRRRLESWKEQLQQRLGALAPVAVELVPVLSGLLGESPRAVRLGTEETLRRTATTISRIVASLGARGRPAVIILDDVQWADAGSVSVVDELVGATEERAVLLCLTCPHTEVQESDPLARSLAEWSDGGARLERIEIGELSDEAVTEMLCAALGRPAEVVEPLATQILSRAGRSPFYIQQFVHHLQESGVIHAGGAGWTWTLDDVMAASIPASFVEVMTLKIARSSDAAQKVLQLASCVGNEFDASLLCEVSDLDAERADAGLHELAREGLLVPCRAGYRFVHDRVREAARATLDESVRAGVHYRAAQIVRSRCSEAELDDRAIEVADHLNRARSILPESDRLDCIRINLRAAARIMGQGDAGTGLRYLEAGRALLLPEDWTADPNLAWQILYQSADALRMVGDYDEALALLDELDTRATSPITAAYVAYRRLNVYAMIDPERAVDTALAALRKLGVRLPRRPSSLRLRIAQIRTDWVLGRGGTRPWSPPTTQVPAEQLPIMLVISGSSGVLIRVNSRLMMLLTAYAARLVAKFGTLAAGSEPYIVGGYAHMRLLAGGSPEPSRRYFERVVGICEECVDPRTWSKGAVQLYGMLQPWFWPRRLVLARLRDTYERSLEFGDSEFAYYAYYLGAVYRALSGVPLGQTLEFMDESAEIGHRLRAPSVQRILRIRQVYRLLIAGDAEALRAAATEICRQEDLALRAAVAPHAMLALCVRGEFLESTRVASAVGEEIWNATGSSPITVDFQLLAALSAASVAERLSGRERRRLVGMFRRAQKCFTRWRSIGPDYAHYPILLEAESARLRGRHRQAIRAYERAADTAAASLHMHHVGLIRTRHASLLSDQRRGVEADRMNRAARAALAEWGLDTSESIPPAS